MIRPRAIVALLSGALAQGCGGGEDAGSPDPVPPPPPSPVVALAANNYQDAVRVPMKTSYAAYTHATLGVSVVDNLLNVPLSFLPVPCPQGGTTGMELTDRNNDSTLDPGDTLHLRWNACRIQNSTSTGLVRVQLTDAVQIAGGREYQITVSVENLQLTSSVPGAPAVTINCIVPVRYTRTATSDHIVIDGAAFSSGQIPGDTGTATVVIDYLQDRATQTYTYVTSGNAISSALGGEVTFATALPFTGVLGEYPSSGRLTVTGTASSSARLSEEGTAAGDIAAVFAAVDANGDGVVDASNAALAWATIVPVRLFTAYDGQVVIGVPMP